MFSQWFDSVMPVWLENYKRATGSFSVISKATWCPSAPSLMGLILVIWSASLFLHYTDAGMPLVRMGFLGETREGHVYILGASVCLHFLLYHVSWSLLGPHFPRSISISPWQTGKLEWFYRSCPFACDTIAQTTFQAHLTMLSAPLSSAGSGVFLRPLAALYSFQRATSPFNM